MWNYVPQHRARLLLEVLEDRVVLDNTLATAADLGLLTGQQTASGVVGQSDPVDFHRLSLEVARGLSVRGGTGLALALIRDANDNGAVDPGEVVASSTTGTLLTGPLVSDAYFLRVSPLGIRPVGDVRYALTLTADLAGGLRTPRDLGQLSGRESYNDHVSAADPIDTYVFRLDQPAPVTIQHSGLNGDFELIADTNFNARRDAGEVVASQAGTFDLAPGRYFVRLLRDAGQSAYTLTFTVDLAGATAATARDLGEVTVERLPYFDFVGSDDPTDVYRIALPDGGTLNAQLTGLQANADVEIVAEDGTVLASSTLSGTADELARVDLPAGSYLVRVLGVEGATEYTLTVWWRVQDLAGNTFNTALDTGVYPATREYSDFVGSSDTDDYFKIELFADLTFTALLTMNTLASLNADADLQLIRDVNGNGINDDGAFLSSQPGITSEQILEVNLLSGVYFVRVYRVGGEVNYTLRLTTDLGGSSPESAYDLGLLTTRAVRGYLNQLNTSVGGSDYYRFTLTTQTTVTLTSSLQLTSVSLRDLASNALLPLIDNPSVVTLPAGNYLLHLNHHVAEEYRLTFETEPRPFGQNASNLGTLTSTSAPLMAEKAANQGSDPIDFYRFGLNATDRAFTVALTGLTANADLLLYGDSNNNGAIDAGELITIQANAGTISEYQGLNENVRNGDYFIGVRRFNGAGYTVIVTPNYRNPTLPQARDLGELVNAQTFRDFVGGGGREDWYRFTLPPNGFLTAQLLGTLKGNVDLQLIQDSDGDQIVDAGEVKLVSSNPGTALERLSGSLAGGTYYLRVQPAQGDTTYELTLNPDGAGNTLGAARNLLPGLPYSFGAIAVGDAVSADDPNDFYFINLPTAGLLRVDLTGLSADANLELIQDANFNGVVDAGDVLVGSNLSGTQAESVQRSLSAGRYFVRVSRAAGATSYQLRLLFDAVGNTPGTGLNLGTLAGVLGISDAVNAGSDLDFFRFELPTAGTVNVTLTGGALGLSPNTRQPSLTGNLGLRLIQDANNNGTFETSEVLSGVDSPGTASEQLSFPLSAGVYFIQVYSATNPLNPVPYTVLATVDRAGGTAATSRDLGALTAQQSITDHIGLRDLNDFYRFTLSASRTVSVSLVGFAGLFRFLDADADLRLYRDANNNGIADDNEVIASSTRTGVSTESLSQALSAGTYFVRVDALKTQTSTVFLDTNYLLSLS